MQTSGPLGDPRTGADGPTPLGKARVRRELRPRRVVHTNPLLSGRGPTHTAPRPDRGSAESPSGSGSFVAGLYSDVEVELPELTASFRAPKGAGAGGRPTVTPKVAGKSLVPGKSRSRLAVSGVPTMNPVRGLVPPGTIPTTDVLSDGGVFGAERKRAAGGPREVAEAGKGRRAATTALVPVLNPLLTMATGEEGGKPTPSTHLAGLEQFRAKTAAIGRVGFVAGRTRKKA